MLNGWKANFLSVSWQLLHWNDLDQTFQDSCSALHSCELLLLLSVQQLQQEMYEILYEYKWIENIKFDILIILQVFSAPWVQFYTRGEVWTNNLYSTCSNCSCPTFPSTKIIIKKKQIGCLLHKYFICSLKIWPNYYFQFF